MEIELDLAALRTPSGKPKQPALAAGGLSDPASWQRIQLAQVSALWDNLPLPTKLALLAAAIISDPYPQAEIHTLLRNRDLLGLQLPTTILVSTLYCTGCRRLINLPESVESASLGCTERCIECAHSFPQLSVTDSCQTPISGVARHRLNWLPHILSNLPPQMQQQIWAELNYQRTFISTSRLNELCKQANSD